MKAKLHIPGQLQATSIHSDTHRHVGCLLMLLNAFLSAQGFVLVRGCATPPSSPARPLPLVLRLTARQDRDGEERKEDHISQSQRCISDIGNLQPAISHKHLPARLEPSISSISSISSIDFRRTGVVIASVDVTRCLPALPCAIPLYVMAVMYVGPLACLQYQVNCYIPY